ncbi:hypothetical protein MBLNU459_g2385t2 [Dothideomycetes sp. NU459]
MTAGLEDHVAPAISSDTNDVIREPARVILRLWRADIEEEYEDYYGIEEAFLKFWGYAIVDSAEHKRHSMHIMPGEEHDKTYHITLDLNMNSACDKLVEDIRHLFYRGRKQDDKWYILNTL